jgi:hypothetical protein
MAHAGLALLSDMVALERARDCVSEGVEGVVGLLDLF